ncbi:hypothetical protein ACRALDRAFT_2022370 [Sodiomyces alcalophilus JCM 7366]|uniref:uncharacterized protein n=1 Tax=Sodiomyces alcalophilus JCM 7366 TaxID=591952 RepID=UPI0039B41290
MQCKVYHFNNKRRNEVENLVYRTVYPTPFSTFSPNIEMHVGCMGLVCLLLLCYVAANETRRHEDADDDQLDVSSFCARQYSPPPASQRNSIMAHEKGKGKHRPVPSSPFLVSVVASHRPSFPPHPIHPPKYTSADEQEDNITEEGKNNKKKEDEQGSRASPRIGKKDKQTASSPLSQNALPTRDHLPLCECNAGSALIFHNE